MFLPTTGSTQAHRHTGAAPTHLLRSVRDEDRARVHARAHLTPRPLRENKISVVFSPSNTQSATRYDVARRDTAIAKGTNTKKNRSEKEEGVTRAVHGRSRLTIDPRIPTMPGRSTPGFHRPRKYCLHQGRSAVRSWASRIKGELHPTTKPLLRRTFSHTVMTSSNKLISFSGVATSRDSNGGSFFS